MNRYIAYFTSDIPPAYGGHLTLYWIAVFGLLGVVMTAGMFFTDVFEDIGDDRRAGLKISKGDPIRIMRRILILLMLGTLMRSFPTMVQNMCRPELSDINKMRWTLASYMLGGVSWVPTAIATYMWLMSKSVIYMQLRKQPIEVDPSPRWGRIRKLAIVMALVAVFSTLATIETHNAIKGAVPLTVSQ